MKTTDLIQQMGVILLSWGSLCMMACDDTAEALHEEAAEEAVEIERSAAEAKREIKETAREAKESIKDTANDVKHGVDRVDDELAREVRDEE